MVQYMLTEDRPEESDHLVLRTIAGFETGHEIPHPVVIRASTSSADFSQQIAGHSKKLVHGHDIQHLRVNGYQNRCCCRESRQCQIAELRRAIDDDDVVEVLRLSNCLTDTGKE